MKRLGFFGMLFLFAVQAAAQSYPAKAVRMIVPYPPGGGNDTLGAPVRRQAFGPHGAAVRGREPARRRRDDRHRGGGEIRARRLHHPAQPRSRRTRSAPNLYSRVPYDPVKDFAPITLLGIAPTVLVVNG